MAGVVLSVPLIDVRGSLATNWVGFGAAASFRGRRDAFGASGSTCVAGVTLSVPS